MAIYSDKISIDFLRKEMFKYMLEDKICSFNVNEFHLVTMLMPYIYEAVNKEKKITTFFEKDLTDIYEKIVNSYMKFFEAKSKFDKIDWKALEKFDISKKFNEDCDIVIVAGKENFIDKINILMDNFHTKFTLINCYEVDDFNKNLKGIVKEYDKILCTQGVREMKELYLV